MAQVQYMVMYRYMHPVANKPVTNKQKDYKDFSIDAASSTTGTVTTVTPESKFKVADLGINPSTGITYTVEEYAAARNYTTDKVYDMLFVFTNVGVAVKNLVVGTSTAAVTHKISVDKFVQVNGDPWFIASVSGSLESAMATAKRLVMKIGISNVKVVKQVPLELQIEIE